MSQKRLGEILDKRMLWIVIISLFAVIFILISGMLSGSFSFQYSSGLLSTLGTFGGALVGAFGAGYFTLLSVEKQIRSAEITSRVNEITNRINEINPHLRVGVDFIARVNAIINEGNDFKDEIDNEIATSNQTRFSVETHKASNDYSKTVASVLKEVNLLNLQVVPFDYYKEYVGSVEIVKILETIAPSINNDLNQSLPRNKINVAKNYTDFLKYHNQLEALLGGIRTLNETEQQELFALKKERKNLRDKS